MVDGTITDSQLPRDIAARVQGELELGEKIVWLGQPDPGRLMKRSFWGAIMGIPLVGFGLIWMAATSMLKGAHMKHSDKFLPLVGLLFFLIGVAVLLSPLRMLRKARRIVYVLTDRRALIVDATGGAVKVRSYTPETLRDLRRVDNGDGSGDLILERVVRRNARGRNFSAEHGFLAVANVKEVEAMVGKLTGG